MGVNIATPPTRQDEVATITPVISQRPSRQANSGMFTDAPGVAPGSTPFLLTQLHSPSLHLRPRLWSFLSGYLAAP